MPTPTPLPLDAPASAALAATVQPLIARAARREAALCDTFDAMQREAPYADPADVLDAAARHARELHDGLMADLIAADRVAEDVKAALVRDIARAKQLRSDVELVQGTPQESVATVFAARLADTHELHEVASWLERTPMHKIRARIDAADDTRDRAFLRAVETVLLVDGWTTDDPTAILELQNIKNDLRAKQDKRVPPSLNAELARCQQLQNQAKAWQLLLNALPVLNTGWLGDIVRRQRRDRAYATAKR